MAIGRNRNYELIYVLIAMLVIICMCVLGRFTSEPMLHLAQDVQLREFEAALKSIQHPTQTKQISLKTLSGDIADSKKGCDYFVGEIRSYQGSRDEIINGYASQSV